VVRAVVAGPLQLRAPVDARHAMNSHTTRRSPSGSSSARRQYSRTHPSGSSRRPAIPSSSRSTSDDGPRRAMSRSCADRAVRRDARFHPETRVFRRKPARPTSARGVVPLQIRQLRQRPDRLALGGLPGVRRRITARRGAAAGFTFWLRRPHDPVGKPALLHGSEAVEAAGLRARQRARAP
jgi:hypothetical protein